MRGYNYNHEKIKVHRKRTKFDDWLDFLFSPWVIAMVTIIGLTIFGSYFKKTELGTLFRNFYATTTGKIIVTLIGVVIVFGYFWAAGALVQWRDNLEYEDEDNKD